MGILSLTLARRDRPEGGRNWLSALGRIFLALALQRDGNVLWAQAGDERGGRKKGKPGRPARRENDEETSAGQDDDDDREGEDPEEESGSEEDEEETEEEGEGEVEAEAPRDWTVVGEDDTELIGRFLKGNRESFNRLVLKYQHKVFNLCYRMVGDRQEAEDLAQEIFITIHKSLGNFRGDSLFSTWLFRISVNHCKNRIKYLGRRKYYHSLSLDQPQETEDGDLHHDVEDEGPGPETAMASSEIQALVQEAISALDPDHRIVIVMRDIEDKSYEEIADHLNIKVGTVKSRIHRARAELKVILEGKVKWRE
jgi:RNA polymerase sigma-70 factor (ECF subfamily)